VIDPWAGSYMMEKLTQEMADKAWAIIEEVEAMGGMTKAVDSGWAKLKIEAAPPRSRRASTPARTSSSASTSTSWPRKIRSTFWKWTMSRCVTARSPPQEYQGEARCPRSSCAGRHHRSGRVRRGNLLDLSIKAVRLRATVGEVSDALEKAFGRHRADTQKVTGVYAAAYDSAEGWDKLKEEINTASEQPGPPSPRDDRQAGPGRPRPRRQGGGHGLADLGFDVDMGPLFQTPKNAPARPSRTMCTRGSPRWPPVTRPWCRPSLPSSRSRARTTSSSSSAA
jgi:methylmalonyl-CoA mutase